MFFKSCKEKNQDLLSEFWYLATEIYNGTGQNQQTNRSNYYDLLQIKKSEGK